MALPPEGGGDTVGRRLARAAGAAALGMLLSRCAGLARDLAIAYRFGASPEVDAYLQAFRVPDILAFLVMGGATHAAVVPLFVGDKRRGDEDAGWRMAGAVLRGLLVAMAGALLAVWGAAPLLARVLGAGFDPARRHLTVDLIRLVAPFAFPMAVSAVCAAALTARGRFLIPAASWALFDVGIIAGALRSPADVRHLALGADAGATLMALCLLAAAGRAGFRPRHVRPGGDTAASIRRASCLFGPAAVGMLAGYLGLEAASLLATFLPPGAVLRLRYADRFALLPVALIGGAVGVAALSAIARGEAGALRAALRLVVLLSLPSAAGLYCLRGALALVLLAHGRFTPSDAERLASLLAVLAPTIPVHAVGIVLTSALQSRLKPAAAAGAALWGLSVQALVTLLLLPRLGETALVLGLASGTLLATALLGRRVGVPRDAMSFREVAGSVAGSGGVACAACLALRLPCPPGVCLGVAVLAGIAVYAAAMRCTLGPWRHLLQRGR